MGATWVCCRYPSPPRHRDQRPGKEREQSSDGTWSGMIGSTGSFDRAQNSGSPAALQRWLIRATHSQKEAIPHEIVAFLMRSRLHFRRLVPLQTAVGSGPSSTCAASAPLSVPTGRFFRASAGAQRGSMCVAEPRMSTSNPIKPNCKDLTTMHDM